MKKIALLLYGILSLLQVSFCSVQDSLDNGASPFGIYSNDHTLLDSLYGKTYQGGIIFYLDTINGDGLVSIEQDTITADDTWGCTGTNITGAEGIIIGTGTQNTTDISWGCFNSAATTCKNLVYNGYSDWFLPSRDELIAMNDNLHLNGYGNFDTDSIGVNASGLYWSSSENPGGGPGVGAFVYFFSLNYWGSATKNSTLHVRAIRKFTTPCFNTSLDVIITCDPYTWIDGNTYSSNNNIPSYYITGGAANGCDSLVYLNLTFTSIDADYTTINNGNGNYYFNNNSTGNYTQSHWAFGDGSTSSSTSTNHTFTNNGSYIIVLTINNSAISTPCVDFFIDTVIIAGLPTTNSCLAGVAIYPDTINGGLIVVNSSIGTSLTYLWDFGDGSTSTLQNPSHIYTNAGPFYLCLMVDDGIGCSNTYCDSIGQSGVVFKGASGFLINVISPTSVGLDNQITENSAVTIYPNPTANQLTIVSKAFSFNTIKIIDVTGRVVMTLNKKETDIINVADLPASIYFIHLIGADKTIIKKFVKE